MKNRIKKNFEIETSREVMTRIERFLALLHHNSNFGHTATFAMPLDGDGEEVVKVTPTPYFSKEVDLIGSIGGSIEIAYNDSYGVCNHTPLISEWEVKTLNKIPTTLKNGKVYKQI